MKTRGRGKLRDAYIELFDRPEYKTHVHVVRLEDGRHSLEAFLTLISSYRATLSPPGKGYDTFRTWQAVALGTVPLVTFDATFDQRLFERTGAVSIPRPEQLSPAGLAEKLASLVQPSLECATMTEMRHWREVWAAAASQRGPRGN
jgi:hypothetical protein